VLADVVNDECTSILNDTALASGSLALTLSTGRASAVYLYAVVDPGRV
jgi:hypothetical protein